MWPSFYSVDGVGVGFCWGSQICMSGKFIRNRHRPRWISDVHADVVKVWVLPGPHEKKRLYLLYDEMCWRNCLGLTIWVWWRAAGPITSISGHWNQLCVYIIARSARFQLWFRCVSIQAAYQATDKIWGNRAALLLHVLLPGALITRINASYETLSQFAFPKSQPIHKLVSQVQGSMVVLWG